MLPKRVQHGVRYPKGIDKARQKVKRLIHRIMPSTRSSVIAQPGIFFDNPCIFQGKAGHWTLGVVQLISAGMKAAIEAGLRVMKESN